MLLLLPLVRNFQGGAQEKKEDGGEGGEAGEADGDGAREEARLVDGEMERGEAHVRQRGLLN